VDRERPPIRSCPQCGSRRVGHLGGYHFFCGDCCQELQVRPSQGRIDVFDIDEEGNLTAVGSLRLSRAGRPAP